MGSRYSHPRFRWIKSINRPISILIRKRSGATPFPARLNPLGNSIRTDRFQFEVIPTPGHDRDHVCLFEPQKGWLFSGDLYVGTRPVVCRPMDDQWQILEDLKTVRDLKPRILFPAPGNVIIEPGEKLDKVISHLETLGRRIEALHKKGLNTADIRLADLRGRKPHCPKNPTTVLFGKYGQILS